MYNFHILISNEIGEEYDDGYPKFSDPLQNRRCLPLKPQNFYNRFKEKFCLQRVAPTGSVLAVVNLTKMPPEIFPYDAPDLKIDI